MLENCEVVGMTQYATALAPAQRSTLLPVYSSDLERTIGVLQQLQVLCLAQGDVLLGDVLQVLHTMQQEFGKGSSLENVIQALVGRQLHQQLALRRVPTREATAAHTPIREALQQEVLA
jgi:hypothetical protein